MTQFDRAKTLGIDQSRGFRVAQIVSSELESTIHSSMLSEPWTAFFLLLARLFGFFVLSPLFSSKRLSIAVRMGICVACSLLLTPPFMGKLKFSLAFDPIVSLFLLKELLIGYLAGFIFSLLLEAAAFAGQLLGALMGFSATELLDPIATSSHPLLARFFSLFFLTLFFVLDLHHPLLNLIFDSFERLPIHATFLPQKNLLTLAESVQLLFQQALQLSLFPLFILLSLIIVFALLSRFFSIFWVGFPLQLLVGFAVISIAVGWFPSSLEAYFFRCTEIVKKFIVNY